MDKKRTETKCNVIWSLAVGWIHLGKDTLHCWVLTLATVKQRGFNLNNFKVDFANFVDLIVCIVGRDSSVGIATGYGQEGPGIESRSVRDFPVKSR